MASDDDILKSAAEYFGKTRDTREPGEGTPPEEMEERRRQQIIEREVRIVGVFESPQGGPFVLLRDTRGRNLPIFVGPAEALSITLAVDGHPPARPLTHDLIKQLMERLGARVDSVLVDDLYKNVFYAKLALRHGDKVQDVDCRSSDAIAIALRYRAPIYVADHVLEEGQCEVSDD